MKKSISTWSFSASLELQKQFALAKEAGFAGFQVALDEGGTVSLKSDEKGLAEVRKQAEAAGLTLSGLATGLYSGANAASEKAETRERAAEILRRQINAAALLGIDGILVVPGAVGVDFIPGCEVVPYEVAHERATAFILAALPEAERKGVTIAIENVWNKFLLSPLEMRGFIDQFGSERVGAYFDVGNALASGYPEHWIDILGPRIKRVHFKDYRRAIGSADGFVELLSGDVNWPAVMKALHGAGYDGWVAAEMIPPVPFYKHAPEVLIHNTSRAMDAVFKLAEGMTQLPASTLLPPLTPENRFEQLPIWIGVDAGEVSRRAAQEIAELIRTCEIDGRPAVLGLATGSTPVGVYRELIRLHREENLSFRNVITFNLDEYYALPAEEPESYHHFMREQLFAHVDILPENVNLPDGMVPRERVAEACRTYEQKIREAGGLDLQILGIGRTGHIGFNEPGSTLRSRTRVITLDHLTRRDNAPYFSNPEDVPIQALTMGIATILNARRVLLLAFGEHKAEIVQRAFEGEPDAEVPASFLQEHDNVLVMLDPGAAAHLTRIRRPWLTGPLADLGLAWDETMMRRAVAWLAEAVGKPVLKLTDFDYNDQGLQELLGHYGTAYDINLLVFRILQKTITGWPAGRPHEVPAPRRILIFSPHPDDDVISMGGTLIRLAQQGHEVHIAYQVSGSNAVPDRTVQKFMRFGSHLQGGRAADFSGVEQRPLKAFIRRLEAIQAADICHVPENRLHFLDLPFYDAGAKRRALSNADITPIRALLEAIQPHQIYAAGDLADPHGTHRLCLEALEEALQELAGADWLRECPVWLYRGAWKEWEIHEVEMSVPISPGEVLHKRRAIFQHETQKDQAMFLGEDGREFWQRAEDRTRASAQAFRAFGMVDYEAIETFARLRLGGI